MTSGHIPVDLLDRYAIGEPAIEADALWAVEAHLETCAGCRARLAGAVAAHGAATAELLVRVRAGLDVAVAGSTPAGRRRPRTRAHWAAPALLPRLSMTLLVVLTALGLDRIDDLNAGRFPSLVLLLAPVAPLLGVAAAWSRGLDPAHELVVASPRAGLYLVLRRTVAVLVAVIPMLAVAGWLAGTSPARWLLPCLAFTVGALALGELVGLHRAATGLALLWAAAVMAPSLVSGRQPVLLTPAFGTAWAVVTAAVALAMVLRRNAYTGLPSAR
jgi:hypothetical protein